MGLEINTELSNYLAILADREFEDQSLPNLEKELASAAAMLQIEYRSRERQRLEKEMRDAERVGDHARIKNLLAEFNNL